MIKQELLTRLAKDCATWEDAIKLGSILRFDYLRENKLFNSKPLCECESEWLAERARLMNKPQWRYAPKNAVYLAFDDFVKNWRWYCSTVTLFRYVSGGETWSTRGDTYFASEPIAVPVGYDWKQSLEKRPT